MGTHLYIFIKMLYNPTQGVINAEQLEKKREAKRLQHLQTCSLLISFVYCTKELVKNKTKQIKTQKQKKTGNKIL